MPACISFCWMFLTWSSWSTFMRSSSAADLVGRVRLRDDALALVVDADDAGLELLARSFSALTRLRHRIAHGRRVVDRDDHGEGCDGARIVADEDDVDPRIVGPEAAA